MPSEFALQNGVQPLAAAAPKNQPCPALQWWAASKAWAHNRAAGGSEKVTAHHRGGNRVLALGHRVGAPDFRLRVLAGAKIWVPSALQSGSAASHPSRATHPQHFGCQFASAANSANSKFHSHLWKGARIAKIRLSSVFRKTNTHVKLNQKFPQRHPKHVTGVRLRRAVQVQRGSRMGARWVSSVPGCGTSILLGHPHPCRAGPPAHRLAQRRSPT